MSLDNLTSDEKLLIIKIRQNIGSSPNEKLLLEKSAIISFAKSLNFRTPYFLLTPDNGVFNENDNIFYYNIPVMTDVLNPHLNGSTDVVKYDDIVYNNLNETLSTADAEGSSAMSDDDMLIPETNDQYVPFGFYNNLSAIIESKMFYPIFIAGDSGYGKTLMVEQACANKKRKLIRIPISRETDKSSLLVVPTLENGNLQYKNGPVLDAMEQGAVLLLDECDRGTSNLLCLQGILEGKPYYNEKTQSMIHPKSGFTIIATGNSKGQGSDSKYLVNILDSAFLERFPIMIIQDPPDEEKELIILKNRFNSHNISDDIFIFNLVRWARHTREAEKEGIDESISTRRLVAICDAYSIFKNKTTAIKLCLNRFPDEIKDAFFEFYTKIDDANLSPAVITGASGEQDAWS